MKKCMMVLAVAAMAMGAKAQTQKNWYLIGANLSNIGLDLQKHNTSFSFQVTPKAAWFIKDNLAVGGEVDLGIETAKGYTNFSYGIGPLARYYFSSKEVSVLKKTTFFGEANIGIAGNNVKSNGTSVNTNGLGYGFGPGLAYFVNQNIALEALLKYNGSVGFGNSTTTNGLNFGLGLQIYLPKSKLKAIAKDVK